MVSLTGYGGIKEVGGNKFIVQDGQTKILLDFGMNFGIAKKYFNEFLQPRRFNGIGDWTELKLLPDIKGIYRQDYLSHMARPEEMLEYQALFITHAHADHASYVHFLRPDLPIYSTPETFAIMRSMQNTGAASMPLDLCTMKKSFQLGKTKDGRPKRLTARDEGIVIERKLQPAKDKVTIGNIEVETINVNHSLPGAAGLLIHTPRGSIAYTGDLRFHGYNGKHTEDYIKKAAGAKYLVLEGTGIERQSAKSEKDISEELAGIIRETKGIALASWPARDTERLLSFYNAAVANDRLLAISTKQAYLLEQLAATGANVPKLDDQHIRVFVTRRGWGLLGSNRTMEEVVDDYKNTSWEIPYLEHKNMVSYKELRSEPSRYVVRTDLFDMTELIDLQPPEGSSFIRSMVEPLDDEMEIAEEKLRNWLGHFKIKIYDEDTHCSGHAPFPDLKRIVETIQPEFVIPVHTVKPRKFKELGVKVIYPKYGKEIGI